MLKNITNQAQKERPETEHTRSVLRGHAEVIRRNRWFKYSISCGTYFRYHLLPVVPFDAYLRLFVRRLNEHPLFPSKKFQGSTEIARFSWTETTESPYPENIFNDVKMAVAGLAYVYTMPKRCSDKSPPEVLRTKFTPYSAAPFTRRYVSKDGMCFTLQSYMNTTQANQIDDYEHWQPTSQNVAVDCFPKWAIPPEDQQVLCGEASLVEPASPEDCWGATHEHPVFNCPPGQHLGELLAHKVEKRALSHWKRFLPHHEKELEWLEAFLRVVTFIKDMPKENDDGLEAFPEAHNGASSVSADYGGCRRGELRGLKPPQRVMRVSAPSPKAPKREK